MQNVITTNDELYHYGVKGMKWGVRHEYEPVGRHRSYSSTNSQSFIQKHRSAMMMAVGAGVFGVGAAYVAVNYGNLHMDKVLKAGLDLSRVTVEIKESTGYNVYAAYKKKDVEGYRAIINDQIIKPRGQEAHNRRMVLKKDLKVCGINSGDKVLKQLRAKDKNFDQLCKQNGIDSAKKLFSMQVARATPEQMPGYEKMLREYNQNRFWGRVNVEKEMSSQKMVSQFLSELENRGYGAIVDANDINNKFADHPIIMFNNFVKNNVSDKDDTYAKISNDAIKKARKLANQYNADRIAKDELAPQLMQIGGIVGATGAVDAVVRRTMAKNDDKEKKKR